MMEIGDLVFNAHDNNWIGLVIDLFLNDSEVGFPPPVANIYAAGAVLKNQLLIDWEVIL